MSGHGAPPESDQPQAAEWPRKGYREGWYLPVLNYLPFLYVLVGGAGLTALAQSWLQGVALVLGWLYLVPPLLARMVLWRGGLPAGSYTPAAPEFFRWWLLTQLQTLYSRFPATEEVLRLVPGLYSLWLRLWGSRVSLFVYWSPGVVVMDRYALQIGSRVVIAPGARLGAHVVQHLPDGSERLILGSVRIDEGAMIGIMAGVGPGCHVHAHETLPPRKYLRPNVHYSNGRSHDGRTAEPSVVTCPPRNG